MFNIKVKHSEKYFVPYKLIVLSFIVCTVRAKSFSSPNVNANREEICKRVNIFFSAVSLLEKYSL